jgi:Subtilase family
MRIPLLLSALLMPIAAQAQVRLPALPAAPALLNVPQTLNQADSLNTDQLTDLRQIQIKQLIRANRRTVDTDPNGAPVVRGEILALSLSDQALALAQAHGFVIDRQQSVAGTDIRVVVLKIPGSLSARKALQQLRDADPNGVYDYNHIYGGGGLLPDQGPPTQTETMPLIDQAPSQLRAGLLDTGIDAAHPVFRNSRVHTWGCNDKQIPAAHGTAVASLLIAHGDAELYAADVYCGVPTGGAVDSIVAALGWMVQERVAVINVSLVGPKNTLLEQVVGAVIARGHVIVAAVGNDGPAAPPLYPAAYPGVVGVTAVDAHRHVLIEAERGPQVMFAALGADLKAATLDHAFSQVRGTSFAAPTVAALLAAALPAPDPDAARAAIAALAKQAIHIGAPGRDLTYGFGLVGANGK